MKTSDIILIVRTAVWGIQTALEEIEKRRQRKKLRKAKKKEQAK